MVAVASSYGLEVNVAVAIADLWLGFMVGFELEWVSHPKIDAGDR